MSGTMPARWALGGAGLLLALAALGTGAGPLLRLHDSPSGGLPLGPGTRTDPPDRPHPTLLPDPDPDPGATHHASSGHDLRPLLHVVGVGLVTLLVVAALALLVRALRGRSRPATAAAAFSAGGSAPERAALADAVQQADAQLAGDGSARERVLLSWQRLEQSVATTGVVRAPGETSAELTRRVLSEHAVAVATLTELHGLYREARYSRRPVPGDVPERAGALLGGIRRDLLGEP